MPTDTAEQEGKRGKIHFKRISYLVYGVVLINFSFLMWIDIGYLNLPVIAAIWILLALSFLMIIYSAYEGEDIPFIKAVPLASFIISMYVILSVLISVIPPYGTDEIAIDYYAAYLSLHGLDPYVNANMLNVFTFTAFPQSLITPLATGGAVKYFVYPGLSAILFMPAVIFGFPPYVMLVAFNVGFIAILYLHYRKEHLTEFLPLLVVAMLLDVEYTLYSAGGVTDIVWVTFIGLSYIFRKNWKVSGSFYGIALAFKQIPIIILPFYLYFLHKQEGYSLTKGFKFLFIAAFAFLIPNIPYIIMNPYDWYSNIVLIAYQPILGVGIGPSVLSFAGFIFIPSGVFEIALIFTMILFLYLYIIRFDRLKWAFFGFPVVIFLLNYRTLENYLIYWPMLFLLIIPDVLRKKETVPVETSARRTRGRMFISRLFARVNTSRKMVNLVVVGIIIFGAAASAGYEYTKAPNYRSPFSVMNVTGYGDPYQVPDKITSLTVQMNYTPLEGGPSHFPVYYRIFVDGKINNVNALLWSSSSSLTTGITTVSIYPNTASDILSYNTTFVLEAYYGNYTSFLNVKSISNSTPVWFPNPGLNYPTYSGSSPYPGWKLSSSGKSMSTNYSYLPFGIYMNMNLRSNNNSWSYDSMTGDYNFMYLEEHGYHLSYDLGSSRTNVSTSFSNGNFTQFAGVLLTFDSGMEKLWIGYSPNSGYNWYFINRSEQAVVQNTTDINFSMVYKMGITYNWTFQDATFSYYFGTSGPHGLFHAYFSNTTLYNTTGGAKHILNFVGYQEFNSALYNPSFDFNIFEATPVVEANGGTFR